MKNILKLFFNKRSEKSNKNLEYRDVLLMNKMLLIVTDCMFKNIATSNKISLCFSVLNSNKGECIFEVLVTINNQRKMVSGFPLLFSDENLTSFMKISGLILEISDLSISNFDKNINNMLPYLFTPGFIEKGIKYKTIEAYMFDNALKEKEIIESSLNNENVFISNKRRL